MDQLQKRCLEKNIHFKLVSCHEAKTSLSKDRVRAMIEVIWPLSGIAKTFAGYGSTVDGAKDDAANQALVYFLL